MLINQAKNLATLPFSSLLQLEQSIQRTQQLLTQAQRIAYDIGQIDRAFSTTYAPATSGLSNQTLIVNAQLRWQNALAGLQDAMRTQATAVADYREPGRDRRSPGEPGRQPTPGLANPAAGRPDGSRCSAWACAKPGVCSACGCAGSGQGATTPLPGSRPDLSNHNNADVSLMKNITFDRLSVCDRGRQPALATGQRL